MAEDTPASTDASYQEHDTAVALLGNHGTCAGDQNGGQFARLVLNRPTP